MSPFYLFNHNILRLVKKRKGGKNRHVEHYNYAHIVSEMQCETDSISLGTTNGKNTHGGHGGVCVCVCLVKQGGL